jgi:aspartate aminotransferase/aminotransferase
MDVKRLLAPRVSGIEVSGIRKIFDLAATIKDAVNLSIGQPDFDVPAPIQDACVDAIRAGFNRYTPNAGIPDLRAAVQDHLQRLHGARPESVLITGGTSGGLTLALLAFVGAGDEVLIPDPYFVSYRQLTVMCGGTPVYYDTYPDFTIDAARIEKLITPRTKVILAMSPANPTGVCLTPKQKQDLADLARAKGIVLISDEIYELFTYGDSASAKSLAAYYPEGTIAVGGLSKTMAVTGWRLGWAAGPAEMIENLIKLQQFTFVCAPAPAQKAALKSFGIDLSATVAYYRQKRDTLLAGLRAAGYDCVEPGGAFYLFPRVPAKYPSAQAYVEEAIRRKLLLVPGGVFSTRDTHFRISYAAGDATLAEGLKIMTEMA